MVLSPGVTAMWVATAHSHGPHASSTLHSVGLWQEQETGKDEGRGRMLQTGTAREGVWGDLHVWKS